MVPGSTLRYGSSLRKRTLYPRACRSAPRAADARPFPREETTPPVMKINRAMGGQHVEKSGPPQAENSEKFPPRTDSCFRVKNRYRGVGTCGPAGTFTGDLGWGAVVGPWVVAGTSRIERWSRPCNA